MATKGRKQSRTRSILLSRKHRTKAPNVSLSSKASRAVISRHHRLQKRLAQALARNDFTTADTLKAEIDVNGGLEWYQQASVSLDTHLQYVLQVHEALSFLPRWSQLLMLMNTQLCRLLDNLKSVVEIPLRF